MFIRFVTWQLDDDSQKSLGIFHAAWGLRDHGLLTKREEEELEALRRWFDANLEKPTRFTASKPPYYRKQNKAISWFRDTATVHITKMREMASIVEGHGHGVRMLKSQRVGYVVYEDQHQVVAEPFWDTDC
jgi:hypothetical protein